MQSRSPEKEQNDLSEILLMSKSVHSTSPPLRLLTDQWWFCLFASLTICFGASVPQTCLGLVGTTNRAAGSSLESRPEEPESINITICTDEYFLSAVKNKSLQSLQKHFSSPLFGTSAKPSGIKRLPEVTANCVVSSTPCCEMSGVVPPAILRFPHSWQQHAHARLFASQGNTTNSYQHFNTDCWMRRMASDHAPQS